MTLGRAEIYLGLLETNDIMCHPGEAFVKFTEFNLHPALMNGIQKLGYENCTEIQSTAIPYIQAGKDVAGLAQTGTGKTAAFLLPLMDRILKSRDAAQSKDAVAAPEASPSEVVTPEAEEIVEASIEIDMSHKLFPDWKKQNFILILVPTRELADQVFSNVADLCPGGEIQAVAIFGGTSYDKQIDAVKKGVDIIVATPGRLIDLYKEHVVDLNQIRAMVFDEADRMFDMGFKDDMKFILKRVPRERQFLVFSATLNFDVMNTAYEFGADPVEINISKDKATAENVEDELFHVGHQDKPSHLLSLLKQHKPSQVIIFSNFKKNVERIALFLNKNGYPALGISSLLTQAQRNRVMAQFKSESNQNILVATDVAARGLDVKGVDMVINYEMPDDPENYVHRIGRTGRASAKGRAFSLVSDRDVEALARIEDYTKRKIATGWIEDEFLVKEYQPFPAEKYLEYSNKSGGGGGRGRDRHSGGGKSGGPRGGDRDRDRKFSGKKGGPGPHRFSKKRPDDSSPSSERPRSQESRPHEPKANGASSSAQGSHRDRTTGRHKPKNFRGDRPNRNEKSGAAPARTGDRPRPSNNPSRSSRPPRHGRRRDAAAPVVAPQSLGKKIGGFLKKLFTSDT